MKLSGAFRERVRNSWVEMKENLGRATLQSLGVMLGVASVLGGFSISDSMRQRSKVVYRKIGGIDKLNVQPSAVIKDGSPTALQMANLGLRNADAEEGRGAEKAINAVSVQKCTGARVRSLWAEQERDLRDVGGDFFATEGYQVGRGRNFTRDDLGSEVVDTFFPSGNAIGQTIRIGDVPVTVIGQLKERVFYFRKSNRNMFRWRNRIIAVPATLLSRRFEGDRYRRLDRVTFRIPSLDAMSSFSKVLAGLLKASHRQQEDFRLDDVGARIRRERSQGDVYDIIFLLSGVLSLVGGGIVNVNIQMATLKERIREVGVKMAIGASGREVFKEFMTEALMLTGAGALVGLAIGIGFSKIITYSIGIPLHIDAKSFISAYLLAGAFGIIFALYPAWKASRLSPMEALRYE